MNWRKKVLLSVWLCWLDIKGLPGKIKQYVWNRKILLWWYRLWIRKDEFHLSTHYDQDAINEMGEREFEVYRQNLLKRKIIADKKEFPEEYKSFLEERAKFKKYHSFLNKK